jgi:hypothetical protein
MFGIGTVNGHRMIDAIPGTGLTHKPFTVDCAFRLRFGLRGPIASSRAARSGKSHRPCDARSS